MLLHYIMIPLRELMNPENVTVTAMILFLKKLVISRLQETF